MSQVKLARLADPTNPSSMHYNGIIQLSRSQTAAVADALEPLLAKYGSRAGIALALGVKLSAVQKMMARKASTEVRRDNFDAIVQKIGVDTSKWDLYRGH